MRNREQLSKLEQQYLSNKLTGWKIVSFFLPGLWQIWSRRRWLWWWWLCIALCLGFLWYITWDSKAMEWAGCISWLINVILTLVKFTEKAYRHDMPYFQKYLNEYGKLNSWNESNWNNNYEEPSLSNMNKKSEEDNEKIQNHGTVNKKNWYIVIFIIWVLILLTWVGFFVSTKYVSKEFIYQETKECNKLKDDIKLMSSLNIDDEICQKGDWRSIIECWNKEATQEIFYSPKLNECIVVTNRHKIKWMTSSYIAEYEHNNNKYHCRIYRNWEEIKEFSNLSYNENCSDKFKSTFQKEIEKLKHWY